MCYFFSAIFFFKQKTSYEMRISYWSSDVCSSDLFIDLILHLTDLVWIGRYLGIPGVILILLSFGHSLRKRGVIKSSNPVRLLRLHPDLSRPARTAARVAGDRRHQRVGRTPPRTHRQGPLRRRRRDRKSTRLNSSH